jgi:dihydrofolate reductase
MAKLIYSPITSLDGYIEDAEGKFDWAEPDEEVHTFVNDLERPVGTYLYGRRMYETMVFWESPPELTAQRPFVQDFAGIWQRADKIVYSTTMQTVTSAKTLIEREFDPDAIRQLKAKAGADLSVGGASLAAQAIKAGLVDEYQLFLVPVVVGGGKRFLGNDVRVNLELLDERRFRSGTIYLHYRTRSYERGVAAGDTDAFRALRLDAAPQVPGPTRRPGEGMRSFSAGASTGALVTGVVGDREGGPA